MKRWQWVILIFELVLFAVILILPQVSLPDFAFHGGTAPVLIKARYSPAPLQAPILALALAPALLIVLREICFDDASRPAPLPSSTRLASLCTFLC